MNQNLIIRADASIQIGTGHVMRCLTLANELRGRGAEVAFACREFDGNLCGYIEEKGYIVYHLPVSDEKEYNIKNCPKHAAWLGADWQTDARQVEEIIKNIGARFDWLVVDHYALDERWEGYLRPYVKKIMVIDDLADRAHDCDLLLDQNFYENLESRYDGLVPAWCKKLLGPKYALLRPEFREARKNLRKRDGYVKRIMIFFGGSDSSNETAKALEAVCMLNRPDIAVDVVIGALNPHRQVIERIASELPNCTCDFNVEDMAALMAGADLAVGAGGTTVWEQCALGIPSLVTTVAENQERTVSDMAESGYLLFLGRSEAVSIDSLYHVLEIALQSPCLLISFARKTQSLVDGRGVELISQEMATHEIRFRLSEPEPFNILVTSISRKAPLLKSVRKAAQKIMPGVKIYGGDIDSACIGKYFTDDFWLMPQVSKLTEDDLLGYCRQNNIRCIIPTRDGELTFFSKIKTKLAAHNIHVMVSDLNSVALCMDKLAFFDKFHQVGLPVVTTTDQLELLAPCDSFVIKERYGAGSHYMGINLDKAQAIKQAGRLEHPVFQPYIKGKEASIDIYISKTGKVKGLVARKRDIIINGESQITSTFRNEKLEQLCAHFVENMSFYGHILLQVIIGETGAFHIIECNSRFGGASTLSLTAGLDSFYWFLLESLGVDIQEYPFLRSKTEKVQIRFPEDIVING